MPDALDFLDALLGSPGTEQPALGSEWPRLRTLRADKGLGANGVPDAGLAAAVSDQGEHLVTFDADFRRLLPRTRLTLLEG